MSREGSQRENDQYWVVPSAVDRDRARDETGWDSDVECIKEGPKHGGWRRDGCRQRAQQHGCWRRDSNLLHQNEKVNAVVTKVLKLHHRRQRNDFSFVSSNVSKSTHLTYHPYVHSTSACIYRLHTSLFHPSSISLSTSFICPQPPPSLNSVQQKLIIY